MLHLFDELDGFGEKQVVVPLLVADGTPAHGVPSRNDLETFDLQAENACARAHPAPFEP